MAVEEIHISQKESRDCRSIVMTGQLFTKFLFPSSFFLGLLVDHIAQPLLQLAVAGSSRASQQNVRRHRYHFQVHTTHQP
jgi:hypothetical protein